MTQHVDGVMMGQELVWASVYQVEMQVPVSTVSVVQSVIGFLLNALVSCTNMKGKSEKLK